MRIFRKLACELLGASKSTYYDWLRNYEKRTLKCQVEQELANKVIVEFNRSRKSYGAARILKKLLSKNTRCSYHQVLEIMKVNDLVPVGHHRYYVNTTNSNHKYRVFENLLERNFVADKLNQVLVGDITYIPTSEGWLYLATVIDVFSRRVIGYKMSNRMTRDLVISALLMALRARNYPTGVIIHSDRGSQYSSKDYKAILAKYKLLGSMSRKGDCWGLRTSLRGHNAVAESFFATIKKEYVYQTTFENREIAKLGIFDYIEAWYNRERMHSYLNYLSPCEFEQFYLDMVIGIRKEGKTLGSYSAYGF